MNTENAKMIRLAEVCAMVGLKHAAIYERIGKGTFPAPIKLGKASRWLESEIQAWIAVQIKATRGEPAAEQS